MNQSNNNDSNGRPPGSSLNPILIDFTDLNTPKLHKEERRYEITETAARLSNQLVRSYPVLADNEKNMIMILETVLEMIGRFWHDSKIKDAIACKGYDSVLKILINNISNTIITLRKSSKGSAVIIGLIKDIAEGNRINLH